MTNVPRPGGGMPAALSFIPGAPPKRKAAEITSSNDIDTTVKRQKTAPDQRNPRQRAKNPKAAKTSRGTPKAPATPANTDVAINTAPASAPEATFYFTSSADSNALAAVQDQASQPAAMVAAALSPPPKYNPAASCPVDWTKLPHVEARDIEIYELRAPWNPNPVAFDVVAKRSAYPGKEGKQPSMEGVRKRFKNANSAIFALTGVYFPESSQGLEAWGIKKPAKPEMTASHSARATTTGGWTPARLHGDDEATIYQGEVVAVQLKSPSDGHPSVRICDAQLIPAYDELITYEEMLDEIDEPCIEAIAPFLPFSAKAFDHWHSSVCRGGEQEFPKRTLVCKQIDDDQYMLRVNSKARKVSASLMLETYVVSQAMGTTRTSSMILGELRKKFNNPLTPAMDDGDLDCLRYLESDDPAREVVNRFRWRIAGSSPGSEYSAQVDDDDDDDELL
ncbi:hypothetical protein N0V87_006339 [Didymella glomerata]|uniref:Uncharacterized protein n=1 Tax=Didymella glomerata TaxID=749621 RepID=A0A9W9BYX6_9PLEO|nr:hypothetical protein N0V87_006339 [Didymella glomerata]